MLARCLRPFVFVALVGYLATPALGQSTTAQSIADLGRSVKPGDKIFVTDPNGVQTEGRFLRLSPQELAIRVGGQDQTIPSSRIGRVERSDSLWNGVLLGAIPPALVAAAAASFECEPHCGRDISLAAGVFGAVGAGIGALVDRSVQNYAVLYGPALGSRNRLYDPVPVTLLDELWLRVRQDDPIDVLTTNGQTVSGQFVQVSSTSVTLRIDRDRRDIPASDIRRITRIGNRHHAGALWGGLTLGAMGLMSSAACGAERGCGNPLLVGVTMGAVGAFWGVIVGSAIPKHPVVYEPEPGTGLRVSPLLGPGRVGVAWSVTF